MAENVQCPVCTLYLHAGMNLSDHLETHPKEQVIRALVQMTISGAGRIEKGITIKQQLPDLEEKPLPSFKDNETDIGSVNNACAAATPSNQPADSSHQANNIVHASETKTERNNENEHDKTSTCAAVVPINTVVKSEIPNAIAIGKSNISGAENIVQCFPKQNYNTSLISDSAVNTSHSFHRNSMELTNSTNNVNNNFNIFGVDTRYEQQQRNDIHNSTIMSASPHMPPPPPPPPASPQSHKHQEIAGRGITPPGSNGSFHSMQTQPLPLPPPPHITSPHLGNVSSGTRQSHMYTTGQDHQSAPNSPHSRGLKVIYTPSLPAPPPLQLFTYQPQTLSQQHQKPPPAYGAAISQIRSQHNQSKNQVIGSLATQQQHQTIQTHSVLQQQLQQHHLQQHHLQQHQTLQHNLRIQVPPPPPPPPSPTKHSYSPKTNDFPNHSAISRHNQSILHQQHSKTDLPQHQQPQEQEQPQDNPENSHNSNNQVYNTNDILTKSTLKGGTFQSSNANVPSYPQVSISPSAASASVAAVAASALGRHTNSPFAALLAAAAGAPSPSNTSSVLRYAESPVAHYLERENGDFIVQETPKHIVECVETDNGEFSVIERIYQSPPSVLHIHDDDDDDDNDDDDDEDEEKCKERIEYEQREDGDSNPKQDDVNDGEGEIIKDQWKAKQTKSSKSKKSKKKTNNDVQNSVDNEIVDFVSISSDSGDEEEEFISQERKDHKYTTEKNKKNMSSASSCHSVSMMSTQSASDSSSVSNTSAVTAGGDHSTSTTSTSLATTNTQQNSGAGTNSNTGSRKKSSKNTITVLSDVQLNLNEYLDLVGNIIASSKVAAQCKTLPSIAPIPLVKIEKEEPMDEYAETNITTSTATTTESTVNFETSPPLKANKHETEDITDTPNSSYSKQLRNNQNIILTNELYQEEDEEEKKPQVNTCENEITPATIPNSSPINAMTINSSQVTSVIRMATTSQHQQQEQPQNSLKSSKNSNEVEDLSRTQQKVQSTGIFKTSAHNSITRRGPKKLVIKPKTIKTEVLSTSSTASEPNQNETNDDKELPTTSAKAQGEYTNHASIDEDLLNSTDVKVKNEPINSITYDNLQHQPQYQPPASFSILEQHLTSKEPILDFKAEKPCITEASLPPTSIIKELKIENNVTDDARVLYDFANSKKTQNDSPSTFPSSTSLFSSKQTSTDIVSFEEPKSQQVSKIISHENETSSSTSSSTYSSHSAMDASIPPEEHNESSATSASVAATVQSQNQTNQVYAGFHFNYLYNNGENNVNPVATEQVDIKNQQQFSSFYQNSTNNNNSSMALEDSSSSKHYTDYQQFQNNHHHVQQHPAAGTPHDQWFNNNNYHTSEPNVTPITSNHSISNMNSGLSVDANHAALDETEGNKYLDLDSCKREQNIDTNIGNRINAPPPPPPSSSTSCSFSGTTDNSMAGICSTAATLNIRTDEKMPAKGEISEQESNCDIDNSWSQPMYGDISARFFKTTFPGIFPQDNGWNHEEYFGVQDLSASTTTQVTNSSDSRMKSFDQTNSNITNISGMPIFSQSSNDNCNIDVMPSTSAKIRKKRKRTSQDGKTSGAGKRLQPTSTVTSQQMLMQHHNEMPGVDFSFQHHQQINLQQHHLQLPSTSTTFSESPLNSSTNLATGFVMQQQLQQQQQHQQQQQQQQQSTQQKQRTKVYECGHCNAKYSKLKDRNAHLIDIHNYVRQNRRLVCPTTGHATPLNNSDMQDVGVPTTSAGGPTLLPAMPTLDCMGDYKPGIVKIENENPQRDLAGEEQINANLSAKTEVMEDDKPNLALVPMNAANVDATLEYDTKPPTSSLPLSLTTPSSKLTTLYRMLVSFNMSTLKQNQTFSDLDENLIKSSIFFCYVCRQNFNSVKLYDAHLTEHPAECFTCGKKFRRWKNFSLHLKRHLGWKEFGCTVCDKKFVVRSALVEHMRMHSGLSPLKCKICGKNFKRYSNLTQHRKRHTKHVIRRKEYVCYCGEVLPSKARFLWHKETHDSKPKCCPHCCDRFVHVNSLRRHIRLAHSDKFDYTEPMECPICKQIFAKASMKTHIATHSTETQYDCPICSKTFSTKWNLKIHSWVHANRTTKPFKCEHCPKAFVREVDFKNHMNSHKQIKPYTCEVCGCKFIRKYNYMRHRREHHGNKKYTCDLCKKSFHRHYYLIEHRRIHTGERPFQCSICGKSSTTKTNHNKHLKIHHSRDPFTVEV